MGRLRRRQRAVRRSPRRGRPAGRGDLGPRLPAAARPGDGPRASSGRHHRLLPPRPVPAVGAVRPPAVAQRDHRRSARRRPRRVPAGDGRRELRRHRPAPRVAGRAAHRRLHRRSTQRTDRADDADRPPGQGRRLPDLDRRRGVHRRRRRAQRPPGVGDGAVAVWATPRSSCSASTASTTPRASGRGCERSARCSTTARSMPSAA